jgi:hypothetical protein
MLHEAMTALPPVSLRDRHLRITSPLDGDLELQIGSLILLLSPERSAELAQALQDALGRLDRILASGVWDEEEPEETPSGFLDQLRKTRFSLN